VWLNVSKFLIEHKCISHQNDANVFWWFTGEESLIHDGAVGARFTHFRRDGGGAVKLLTSVVDLGSVAISTPGGGGFARDRTKPAEFLAPLTAFH